MHTPIRQATGLTAVLALGLAFAGCSGSSSGGSGSGSSGSTAAPVTTSGGGTSTSGVPGPAFSMQNVTPATLARQQAAMTAYNDELQQIWDRLLPDVKDRLRNELQDLVQQGTLAYPVGPVTLGVTQLSGMTFDAPLAPAFNELTYDRVVLTLPRQGEWILRADFQVGASATVAGIPITVGIFPITLEVRFSAFVDVDIDNSDPTRPQIARSNNPQANVYVSVTSSAPQAQQYLQYLNQVATPLVHTALQVALQAFLVPALPTFPGAVWADGAAPLVDTGIAVPFEEIAINVDRKIRRDHMPHGLLGRIRMDVSVDDESWETAYVNGGAGNSGNVVAITGESDSAMNTAYFLAGQAWRYKVTQSTEAFDNLAYTLRGIGLLLEVNNDSGLLARCTAPLNSMWGQHIDSRGAFLSKQMYGETWLGWQGHKGVSRDQYTTVFFGLAIAHEIVDDPAVKAECARLCGLMVDFLVREGWVSTIDRPNWTVAGGEAAPLIFQAQSVYQQITFTTIAERMNPGRFTAERDRVGDLASMTWLGAWVSANTLSGYYRFNLQLLNAFNYFRLETDQQRWMEMARGYRITQRWIGHHHNPHYNMIQCGIDPSLEPLLFPQVREALRLFLKRNHREVAPPGLNTASIQWAPFTFGSMTSASGTTVMLPTKPIDIPLRKYTGYYQWQKEPTREAVRPTDPQQVFSIAKSEKPGQDFVLPYWMGRYFGAF